MPEIASPPSRRSGLKFFPPMSMFDRLSVSALAAEWIEIGSASSLTVAVLGLRPRGGVD